MVTATVSEPLTSTEVLKQFDLVGMPMFMAGRLTVRSRLCTVGTSRNEETTTVLVPWSPGSREKNWLSLSWLATKVGAMLQLIGVSLLQIFRSILEPNYLPSPFEIRRTMCTAPLDVRVEVSPESAKPSRLVVCRIPTWALLAMPAVL